MMRIKLMVTFISVCLALPYGACDSGGGEPVLEDPVILIINPDETSSNVGDRLPNLAMVRRDTPIDNELALSMIGEVRLIGSDGSAIAVTPEVAPPTEGPFENARVVQFTTEAPLADGWYELTVSLAKDRRSLVSATSPTEFAVKFNPGHAPFLQKTAACPVERGVKLDLVLSEPVAVDAGASPELTVPLAATLNGEACELAEVRRAQTADEAPSSNQVAFICATALNRTSDVIRVTRTADIVAPGGAPLVLDLDAPELTTLELPGADARASGDCLTW